MSVPVEQLPGADAHRHERGFLARTFLRPPSDQASAGRVAGEAPPAARAATASAVAVLVRPEDAVAAGGAVALALGRGPVVVTLWGADGPAGRAPASLGTRRLAARLAARGHDARGTGRLVVVAIGGGIDEAVRVAAAAADVPAVLAVAGPRDERVDAALRGHDRAVVVGEGIVAELAARSVAAMGVPARGLVLPAAPAARWLAASGVALAAPLRAPVEAALR